MQIKHTKIQAYVLMKLQAIILSIVITATGLLLSGCFDEIGGPYDGPPRVEFAPVQATVWDGGGMVDSQGSHSAQVQLIAPPQDSDIEVNYETVSEATTRSLTGSQQTYTATAVEGEHFDLQSNNSVTIEAGSNFGEVGIDIPYSGIEPGEERVAILELQGSPNDAVIPAENYRHFVLFIQGLEADVQTNFDDNAFSFGEVVVGADTTVTLTITNDGNMQTEASNIQLSGDSHAFTVDPQIPDAVDLEPGEEWSIEIMFDSSTEGAYEAELTMDISNDPRQEGLSIPVSGTVVADSDDDN